MAPLQNHIHDIDVQFVHSNFTYVKQDVKEIKIHRLWFKNFVRYFYVVD